MSSHGGLRISRNPRDLQRAFEFALSPQDVLSGLTHILCIYLIFLCLMPFVFVIIFVMALLCGESPWNLTAVMWSGRRV